MLSRSIKSVLKSSNPILARTSSVACFHHSAKLLEKKTAQLKQDFGPFDKLAQGFNVIKSTILSAPPLQNLTSPAIESIPFTGKAENWEEAVKEAQSLVSSADQERIFDPVKLIGKDLWELKGNITKLLGSGHPFINTIGKHYLQGDTNRIRPLLVLLIAKATCQAEKKTPHQLLLENGHDENDVTQVTTITNPILPTQRRLAEISEMIYTASLLHYDIIDNNTDVVNPGFGNKMAVLAGDFLLARASLALAQLRKAECIELIATCIADIVEGEFMQLQNPGEKNPDEKKAFDYYMEKAYMKSGSLIAQSCKASSVLAGCSRDVTQLTYDYGKHLGIAFQLFDDIRSFSSTAANVNKKVASDWINAPVLLAWEEFSELGPLIKREFSEEGDIEKARVLVYKSSGLKKTLTLANQHVESAIASIDKLPSSEAKSALIQLARNLPTRKD
ncbi:isoprenoid synthase domain-containing protein [Pilaira anomala]|nr:isoprenoid synthase domain-containing protein [Pilaira anomala]